jgi:NADH-quinone oxidoreductase subunit E
LQNKLADLLVPFQGQHGAIIPVLQKVQEAFGYLSPEAIKEIAKQLRLSESEIFGVATFYAQFRFSRPGDHSIRVCLGTACHVRGGVQIMETLERELDIQAGGTTTDYKFGLERVACFGSCALAPVVVVDDQVFGRLTPGKVKEVLKQYR